MTTERIEAIWEGGRDRRAGRVRPWRETMLTETKTLVTCAAPHCGRSHDAFAELVALDFPDKPVLLFCGIKCLWVWMSTKAQGGFHDH